MSIRPNDTGQRWSVLIALAGNGSHETEKGVGGMEANGDEEGDGHGHCAGGCGVTDFGQGGVRETAGHLGRRRAAPPPCHLRKAGAASCHVVLGVTGAETAGSEGRG